MKSLMPNSFVYLTSNFIAYNPNQNCFQQAQQKYRSKKIRKFKFTKEEDEKLCLLVKRFGENNWATVSENMENRNPRQCRERWKNYMNPKLTKNEWTDDDDRFLLKKFQEIGPHWNQIARYFHNRSINSVRNRFVKLNKVNSKKTNVKNNNCGMNMNQNSFQAFPFIQNSSIMYHQPMTNITINTIQCPQPKDIDLLSYKNQSLETFDKNSSQINDPTSEIEELFDRFWDINE